MALKRFNGNPEYYYDTVGDTHELTDNDIIPFTHKPGTEDDEDGKVKLSELKKYMNTAQDTRILTIENKIPSSASANNKLATSSDAVGSFQLSINSSTYVMTLQAKDVNGSNLGTPQTIDLPLETMVVSGSYDSANKKIILTLKNGSTVEFSVADLVSGLQSTITGAATTITSSNLTASRALVSNANGKVAVSDITSTELGYLDGVTSNIQTQINNVDTNAKNLANATGTLAIGHGGTGTTTQNGINTNFIANLVEGDSDVTDGTMFVSSYASDNGFADTNAVNKPYKRKFSTVWNYIKGKISSVLGLTATNYGGNSATATSATNATYATKIGTSSSHPAIGSTSTPVYIDSNGTPQACTAISPSTVKYATCSTAAATEAKATGLTGQTLAAGYRLCVKFTYENTALVPKLTVNGTNYTICRYGTTTPAASANYPTWRAGEVVEFVFDGTYFQMVSANAVSMKLSGSTLYIRF